MEYLADVFLVILIARMIAGIILSLPDPFEVAEEDAVQEGPDIGEPDIVEWEA